MHPRRKNKTAHMWTKVIFGLVYVAILVAFAIQTWELVDWLFPKEQLWMKIVTVFSFDLMAVLYTAVEMFYDFRTSQAKSIVKGMWYITFALSCAASVLEMYMASAGRLAFTYDPKVIDVAYALVIVAFTINIIALTVIVRKEWEAYEMGVPTLSSGGATQIPHTDVPLEELGEPTSNNHRFNSALPENSNGRITR